MTEADVVLGDEDIHCRHLLYDAGAVGASLSARSKVCGNAAGTKGYSQNDNSGGVHTLYSYMTLADATGAEQAKTSQR